MEYAVRFVQTDRANEMEAILAGFASEGWRVVAVTPIPDYWRFWVTLERDVEEAEHTLSKDCWCNPTVEDYREER